jgi:hypothetical protein
VKVTVGMGVELRHNYLPEHRSHHHNDAPKQTSLNPNYRTEERGPPSLLPPKRQAEGEETNVHAGDLGFRELSLLPCRMRTREMRKPPGLNSNNVASVGYPHGGDAFICPSSNSYLGVIMYLPNCNVTHFKRYDTTAWMLFRNYTIIVKMWLSHEDRVIISLLKVTRCIFHAG